MWKPLLAVIIAGLAVGLLWPLDAPEAADAHQAGGPARETVLERERNGHFYVHARVNGELVRFVVDTGASGVALTVEDARRVGVPFAPEEFDYIGEGASGPVRGKLVTFDRIDVEGKSVEKVSGAILEGSDLSLLGQSYLSRFGEVQMRGNTMVLR